MNKEQGGFCRSEYGIHIQQKASTRKGKCLKEVGLLGFEPRKTGPESVVLPLHHNRFLRKLGYSDSNQEKQDQNLLCYHYTIAQNHLSKPMF